jgi:hypothetical protein
VVHHGARPHDPEVGPPRVGVGALLSAKGRGLLLGFCDEEDPFIALEIGQVLVGDVVLALALWKVNRSTPSVSQNRSMALTKSLVMGSMRAEEAKV